MDEHEAMRHWVETWRQAGPELEAFRRKEVREADNLQVLEPPLLAFRMQKNTRRDVAFSCSPGPGGAGSLRLALA
jgi:hypothetical protein